MVKGDQKLLQVVDIIDASFELIGGSKVIDTDQQSTFASLTYNDIKWGEWHDAMNVCVCVTYSWKVGNSEEVGFA